MPPHSTFGSELLALIKQYQQLKTKFEQSELAELKKNYNLKQEAFEQTRKKITQLSELEQKIASKGITPNISLQNSIETNLQQNIIVWEKPEVNTTVVQISRDYIGKKTFVGDITTKIGYHTYSSDVSAITAAEPFEKTTINITFTPQIHHHPSNSTYELEVDGRLKIHHISRRNNKQPSSHTYTSESFGYKVYVPIMRPRVYASPTTKKTLTEIAKENKENQVLQTLIYCPYNMLDNLGKHLIKAMNKYEKEAVYLND